MSAARHRHEQVDASREDNMRAPPAVTRAATGTAADSNQKSL
ncbi:hypothetical protein [Paraburkholderia edwinii]|nr:hypothetical protein [Paraburkholderia edwinii]